jgi:HPt (histidine-containing phosphotransfer) domain-containing protein
VLGRYHRAPEELEAVDGLDVAQGVRRVAGNRKLYLSLLRKFVEGEADAAQRIRESLDRGERVVAERLAHTLKGTAGNLAAGPVQTAAGALEKAIHEGDDAARVESLRASLAAAMDRLTSALRPLLAEPSSATAAAPAGRIGAGRPWNAQSALRALGTPA